MDGQEAPSFIKMGLRSFGAKEGQEPSLQKVHRLCRGFAS